MTGLQICPVFYDPLFTWSVILDIRWGWGIRIEITRWIIAAVDPCTSLHNTIWRDILGLKWLFAQIARDQMQKCLTTLSTEDHWDCLLMHRQTLFLWKSYTFTAGSSSLSGYKSLAYVKCHHFIGYILTICVKICKKSDWFLLIPGIVCPLVI